MCEKCGELDRRINHLKGLVARVTDAQTVAAIGAMTEKIEAEKITLHPTK
ncbi:hypothetical protein [Bradyrhizobium sp. LCT2]|nr:hypothetical protein [Bradyrhizobium sp. LCT2]